MDPFPPDPASAPKVTVLVPAYNAAGTIGAALDSVFGQTFDDFEVVVVDDGSTDGTGEVAAGYGPRVTVLRKPNEGRPAAARNLGLSAARGELIAFLDADDCWEPGKLQAQVEILDARPEVGLVYTADAHIDATGRVLAVNPCIPQARGRIHGLLSVRNVMVGSSVVVRRRAIEEAGGFDESLTSIENWDLWIRVARDWEIEYVDEPLTLYRIHEGNRSGSVELRRANIFRLLAKHHDLADRSPEGRRLRRDAYFHAYFNVLGRAYFGQHQMGPARQALMRAFWLKPGVEVARLLGLSLLGRPLFLGLRRIRRWLSGRPAPAGRGGA